MTTSQPPGPGRLAASEARIDRCRDRYALPEGHIPKAASPWLPFVPQVMIKHLTFDIRGNSAANVLWVQAGASLGRHRHRGPVSGCVLEGNWRYLEYDWVGRPGASAAGYRPMSPPGLRALRPGALRGPVRRWRYGI
ncbi:cupin domain-containing protein [Streptomyces sp. NPDC014733]|uniref:cupin domain-containing protein n=1 Tax=Streptomyces sp. NPDC014733 TaxID=3364885 RepID=UPI0036FC8334